MATSTQTSIRLPAPGGSLLHHRLHDPVSWPKPEGPLLSRTALAAAHVVCDVRGDNVPGQKACVDWDATLAFRRHLWEHGLSIAEGMDTSERGDGGLSWTDAQELIRRSVTEAKSCGGGIACGAGTDQLDPSRRHSLDAIAAAYEEQVELIEALGSRAILRASVALAETASSSEDYLSVYRGLLEGVQQPVIIHWLGAVFDPRMHSYWGSSSPNEAMEILISLIEAHADAIDGVKVSLLDAELEREFRRRVSDRIRIYTGDDYNYPELIQGDETGFSHALLGVLDPLAGPAGAAFAALDRGDPDTFRETLDATLPFAKKLFEPPASRYKVGTVFCAYLAGHQDHLRMVSGIEGTRSLLHLCRLFVLADEAGLLPDPELAADRMRRVLAVHGVND